jgi:hypothetical protein
LNARPRGKTPRNKLNFQAPEVPKQAPEHPSEVENTSMRNSLEDKLDKLTTAVASLTSRMQNLEENASRASNMQSVMQMTPIRAPTLSVDPMSFILHQQLMQSQTPVPRFPGPHETQSPVTRQMKAFMQYEAMKKFLN